jgi:uncharacterized Zn finger protein
MPLGRSYVRNGSVCDLQIEPGQVKALVCGSELYRITIGIKPLAAQAWAAVKRQCAGQIGSVIELLKGKLSQEVMQIITRRDGGLFPQPGEIGLKCTCYDWADMCKHVAAALYGVGARLDEKPELLFVLRKVDHLELIEEAGDVRRLTGRGAGQKTIAAEELSDVFGIELEPTAGSEPPGAAAAAAGEVKGGVKRSRARGEEARSKPRSKRERRSEPPARGESARATKRRLAGKSAVAERARDGHSRPVKPARGVA